MKQSRVLATAYSLSFLILGAITIISAGLHALMYPSENHISLYILIAGIALFCIPFIINPGLVKDVVTNRKTWLWINDIILIIAIVGIGVLLTYIGSRRHYRWDFTRDKLFSLSPATTNQLGLLKKDVKITAFYPTNSIEWGLVEDLLSEYKRYTEKIQFKMVDPYRDPITAKAMNVRTIGTVVVQCETNRKDISDDEMFIRPSPFMRHIQPERPKFQGEQAITSAIVNVTSGAKRKIMFSIGHDEPSISQFEPKGLAGLQQFLTKENYDVFEKSLMEGIPTDTAVVVIVDPKKVFHVQEIKHLNEFVDQHKGNLLVALDPNQEPTGLEKFLDDKFGVTIQNEIIINSRPIGGDAAIIVPTYEQHTIVKDLIEKKWGVLMQLARGMTFDNTKSDWKITSFLKSPIETYSKKMTQELYSGKIEFNSNTDVRGPHNLGLAIEGQGTASGSRVVIFGDGDFFTNNLLRVQGNTDLIINTINWLAGQEQMISIRPKNLEFSQIDPSKMNDQASVRILVISVIIAPLLVVLFGGIVWWTRRRV